MGDSTKPFLGGELLFFGFPPWDLPIFLKEDPLRDIDRDAVAHAAVGRPPTDVVAMVVGVIDIRFSGGGCRDNGREMGKGNGVEDEGLKLFWRAEAEDNGGDKESLLGDLDRRIVPPPKWMASAFFDVEFKTAAEIWSLQICKFKL